MGSNPTGGAISNGAVMTTIVYHHDSKTIATDGQTSRGNIILSTTSEKVTIRDGVKFFTSGKVCDEGLLIDGYFGKSLDVVPECRSIVVDNGVAYLVTCNSDAIIEKCPLSFNEAIGSGEEFALSAMDFGCDAKKAVEYACKRDAYSGGKIFLYSVK